MVDYVNTSEIAQRLGLTRQTVATYARTGRLPAVKLGKSWFIRREDFERLMSAPPVPEPPAEG